MRSDGIETRGTRREVEPGEEECGAVLKGEQGERERRRRVPSAAAGQTFTRGFRREEEARSPAWALSSCGTPFRARRGLGEKHVLPSFRKPRLSDEKAVASSRVTRKPLLRVPIECFGTSRVSERVDVDLDRSLTTIPQTPGVAEPSLCGSLRSLMSRLHAKQHPVRCVSLALR